MNSEPEQPKGEDLRLPNPTPAEASEGQDALTEAAAFASGTDLSNRKQLIDLNRLIRGDRVETHVHRIVVTGAWVVAIGVFASLIMLFYHKLTPESWRFLTKDQVNEIYQFLFTGTLGGLIAKGAEYLNRK